ncbi:uncharacterized protein LOC128309187 [Anopheles moucheti]|uniref:uncharacterized protein LOC128309187 n=1 Tax=Anopheles moucheti TaxID=186751 RepID=UPI0022F0DA72|nr:uncharacterized protein LOC128309187 [Anopheles moucheti]
MFQKKFKRSGMLYKRCAQLEAQFEKEWAEQDNSAGTSGQATVVQSAEDVAVNRDMADEYIEEEYLEDIEEYISDEASILNDDCDEGEWFEEEYLDEEISEIDSEGLKLRDSLRTWIIRNKVSRNASNNLLSILRNVSSLSAFSSLPQDVRTLLKAPVNVSEQIVAVPGGGQMWYQGVECCLQHYFRNVVVTQNKFELNLSTDGVPVYNRSPIQMWPILMQLHNIPDVPVMVVGIFCGANKPSDAETFLRPLVTELNNLQDNKININGKEISISVRVFIADSPARALIKQVCYYNGVHGCMKCKGLGTSLKKPKKVIFEDTTADLRTDLDFRNEPCSAKGHRRGETPLTDLKHFDIVKDVTTSDILHLVHVGVVHKLLLGWTEGDLKPFKKWSKDEIVEISEELVTIQLPSEIHRRFRSLDSLHYWKASELGSFLQYGDDTGSLNTAHHGSIDKIKLYS